ncbi:cyclin-d6-1 [Phtheirospermum japonicum]|uniref:Cyclin-d6-1 n=1 Tax=Phtheirospermum japonicum TaxID=374723 RepID=A0A830BPN3_9LAMI|nr:cyclin-d6-1 [Phtheirospermum japonicum]
MELDLQNPLTSYEDLQYDGVAALFSNESDHAPSLLSVESSDLRFSIRRSAKLTYDIDPFLVYLAVNYVDRFLSKQEILEKRPWISRILVVASLTLAAKMTNVDLSISLSDLQIFISISEIEDSSLAKCLKLRASDIIFNIQQEPKLLEYKPSIIAASALLCSIQELTPPAFSSSEAAISSCEYVNKDALVECVGAMQVIMSEGCEYETSAQAAASGTLTPISVLEGEQGTSSGCEENDNVKRRRLNGFRDKRTLRVSYSSAVLGKLP